MWYFCQICGMDSLESEVVRSGYMIGLLIVCDTRGAWVCNSVIGVIPLHLPIWPWYSRSVTSPKVIIIIIIPCGDKIQIQIQPRKQIEIQMKYRHKYWWLSDRDTQDLSQRPRSPCALSRTDTGTTFHPRSLTSLSSNSNGSLTSLSSIGSLTSLS